MSYTKELQRALNSMVAQRDELSRGIDAIQAVLKGGRTSTSIPGLGKPKVKRVLSPEARERISSAAKARHAREREAKAQAAAAGGKVKGKKG